MPLVRNPGPVLVALIAAGAFFMQFLDGTIIATAMPQMAISFHTTPIAVSIGITAYILTAASVIPVSAWLADRFGTRNVFCAAIAVFTVGSVLCGVSANLPSFTAARILQGVGGAVMTPVGQIIVVRRAQKHELVRSITLMTVPGLLAPVIGPPLGGFITTYAAWPWIFFINVPLGIFGILAVAGVIPNQRDPERRPLDWTGFVLTGAALLCLMSGIDMAGHPDPAWAEVLGLCAAGAALGVAAVLHARRTAHPILDLTPFAASTYSLTSSIGSLFRAAAGATLYLLPLMLQVGFGLSAFQAGLLILFLAASDMAMKLIVRATLRRFGFLTILTVNGLLITAFTAGLALVSPATPLPVLLFILIGNGAFRSLQFTGINTLAYAEIEQSKMSIATTLTAMLQQVSIGFGVAFGAILLQLSLAMRGAAASGLGLADFHFAFMAVTVLALASALGFFRLDRDAGREVSGHGAA